MVWEWALSTYDLLNAKMDFLSAYFQAPGLLLLLIPLWIILFLLYTIRSHPKNITLPSLMFILEHSQRHSPKRFLRRLPINILLIVHFLLITSLVVAAAQPYLMVSKSLHNDEVVIVVDGSMSMQAGNRFETAIKQANKVVGKSNTIVVIYDTPQVIAEDVNAIAAQTILSSLKVSDSTTALHAAAQEVANMNKRNAAIHFYTDGIATVPSQVSFDTIVGQIESHDNHVYIHEIRNQGSNVGIISATFEKNYTTVLLKNYDDADRSIDVKLGEDVVQIHIPPREIATAQFPTIPGQSVLEILANDDVVGDNKLYISSPLEQQYRVLYLTNNPDPYLNLALSLMDFVTVTTDNPPGENVEGFDAYIIDSVNPDLLLPATLPRISQLVNASSGLIIKMSPEMAELNWQGMLPVTFDGGIVESDITILPSKYVEDVAISGTQKVYGSHVLEGTQVLGSAGENIALARKAHGAGSVYYYGFSPQSDFVYDFTYPILFKRWLEDILQVKHLDELNVNTGSILGTPLSVVEYPDGERVAGQISTKNVGFYKVDDTLHAVNTLSDKESSINEQVLSVDVREVVTLSSYDTKVPFELWSYFVFFACALLVYEYFLLKWRREA